MFHVQQKQSKFYDSVYQETFLKKVFSTHIKQNISTTYRDHIGFTSQDIAASYIQLLQFTYEHDEHIVDRISFPEINKSSEILYLNQDAMYNLNILPSGSISNSLAHSLANSLTNSTGNTSKKHIDSCFTLMNKTRTKMGERLLKSRLTHPITNIDELNTRYDMIDLVKPYHRNYSESLRSIIDIDKKYRQIILERSRPSEFNELYVSFVKANELFNMNNNLFTVPTQKLKNITKMIKYIIENFNVENLENSRENSYNSTNIFNTNIFPELDKLFARITEIKSIFNTFDKEINSFGSDNSIRASINVTLDKQGRCILTTTKRAYDCIKKLSTDWIYKISYSNAPKQLVFKLSELTIDSTVNQHVRLRSPLLDKFASVLEKDTNKAEHETNRLFGLVMKKFTSQYDNTVRYLSHMVAQIDVAVSSAVISIENYYTRPQLKPTQPTQPSEFSVIGLRHPLIEKISDDTEYITNDLTLNSTNIGMLLYGLNSSGKSSLLRAIGINVVLAQAGLYCSCDSFTLKCYESLFTKISANDNLFKGQSTFVAEMCCLKDMLQQSNKNSLILCDELTAGTETNSATGIVAASIDCFIQKSTNFIFTTHLHGLMDLPEIKNNKKLNVFHFKIRTEGSVIIQERKLINGSGESQYGIEIANAVGLPKQFISKAYEFRRDYQGIEHDILSNKRSKYNSRVIVDSCTECGAKPSKHKDGRSSQHLHVHHQHHQADADESGKIKSKAFHKNILHNLVVLCEKCHNKHHEHLSGHMTSNVLSNNIETPD